MVVAVEVSSRTGSSSVPHIQQIFSSSQGDCQVESLFDERTCRADGRVVARDQLPCYMCICVQEEI